jgi:VWFA-related protein
MRNTSRGFWAAACVLVPLGLPPEAAPPARAQSAAASEFPSHVEVVTVDAVVVDASGKSVEGLTKDDFVVEEDGQPQPIVTFEAVSVPPEAAVAASPAEPSWTVTNAGPQPQAGRAFALLADDLRLPFEQSQHVRQAMADFISESLSPGDAVIVGTTSGDTWWSARMPEGREDLLGILDRVKGRYVDPATRDHMSEYEAFEIVHRDAGSGPHQDVLEALRHPLSVSERVAVRLWDMGLCGRKDATQDAPMQTYEACFPMLRAAAAAIDGARRERTSGTLQAMRRAIGALAPFRGRKSVVFVSPGFLEDDDLTQQDVATAALDARTAVYFVDARGLATGALGAEAPSDRQSLENPGRETQRRVEELTGESGGAQALAEETGGFTVHNTNDLAAAAERIAAESRTFYLLGFEPPAGKPAKAWRKLRVTARRSGVTTRARRGYRLDAATMAAMARPGGSSVIPVRLASYVLGPVAGDRTRVVTAIEIEVPAVGAPGSGAPAAPLQLRLEATPRGGGEGQARDVSLESAPAGAPAGTPTGRVWRSARLDLDLPVGVHQIRAFVQDPTTGRSGVVEQRVVVPEPTAFHLSTPVLSDQVTAAGGAKGSPSPSPVAHSRFMAAPGRQVLAAFEAFGAAKDPATGQGRVESRVVLQDRGGRPLAAPPASPLVPSPEGRLRQLVALPPLPAGDYDLVITAEDRIAGKTEEVHRAFSVEGPPAVAARKPTPESVAKISPELAAILGRAGEYVSAYGRDFSSIVAEEECRQVYAPNDPARRTLRNTRAGVFFVTLPGPLPWATFRDVWEVDGNEVHEREERLGKLFQDSPATAWERARAILQESARYNLGPVRRTVNIPTLALLFLHPDNQSRFSFDLKGKGSIDGTKVVEVAFTERARPTLVEGDTSAGAPAKGRFWIDPEHGTVLKTDAEYDIDPLDDYHRSRARIVTEYRPEPKMGILVPDRMKETYQSLAAETPMKALPSAHSRTGDEQDDRAILTVEATTRYSGYRRFSVTTNETFTGAPKTPK